MTLPVIIHPARKSGPEIRARSRSELNENKKNNHRKEKRPAERKGTY
jgi:hypothetical protein